MTGLFVPDGSGTYHKTGGGLWAADAGGTFQPVKNGWVADASGTYKKWWPFTVSVLTFTGVKSPSFPSYLFIHLAWTTFNATRIQLRLAGSSTVLADSNQVNNAFDFQGTPGSTYTFNLRAIAADGSFSDSDPVTVTLDPLPAPASFKRNSGNQTSSNWAWNPVDSADTYQIVDTLNANAVKGSVAGPATLWGETGLTASTTYERAVRARLGTATSPISNKVRYTTPAVTGSAPGTYDFRATYAEAWAPGNSSWRGVGAGAIHGDGDNWGGNNGPNATMFFYNLSAIRALSGRVTRFKIVLQRDSVAGFSSPQLNHFIAHTSPTRPAGDPVGFFGASTDTGSLAWGQEAAFDLPVAWGQWLIDAYLNMSGIVWGYVLARYMRGPALASFADQGHIYITIG